MAAAPHHQQQQLNYFQASPVRGQLEPDTDDTRLGWRYVQCTDTPNQLRVLLPPKTASGYARLLELELAELGKGPHAQWTRIMEVRHLKDRMIRKCQRLALPNQQTQGPDQTFRTVTAPPDFRLKEMERYLKGQEPKQRKPAHSGGHNNHGRHGGHDAQRPASPPPAQTPPLIQQHPIYSPQTMSPSSPDASRLHPLLARSPSPNDFSHGYVPGAEFATVYAQTPNAPTVDPYPHAPGDDIAPGADGDEYRETFENEPLVMSPEPLPHPYRGSRALDTLHEEPGENSGFSPAFQSMVAPDHNHNHEHDQEQPSGSPLPPPGSMLMPEAEPLGHEHELPLDQRPIPRRRSSLKRKDSGSRLSGNAGSVRGISWALDPPRTEMVRRDVEEAANELNELRESYRAQLAAIRDEREHISEALRDLHLKESSLRQREDELHHTHQQLEGKELHYRNKVLAALEETKRGMQSNAHRDSLIQ